NFCKRGDCALELDDFPRELINTSGNLVLSGEKLFLNLVDIVAQARSHRLVFVDDLVHDRVKNRFWSHAEQIMFCLKTFADFGKSRRFCVSDRDNKIITHVYMQLTKLNL